MDSALLAGWANFYVITGSAAAAITGLMFIVITLIAQSRGRSSAQQVAAFGTPTVVHLGASFLVATILTAPWPELAGAAIALGVTGVLGALYTGLAALRMRGNREYRPVLEDWIWHVLFPLLAYGALVSTGVLLGRTARSALFGAGAATVLLILVGIHNAWDTVTYIIVEGTPVRAPERPAVVAGGGAAPAAKPRQRQRGARGR